MAQIFADYFDDTSTLATHAPAVGGAYALLWDDTSPTSYLTDFVVDDSTGGLSPKPLFPSAVAPAARVTSVLPDTNSAVFSMDAQFKIEVFDSLNFDLGLEVWLFKSSDIGAFDRSSAFDSVFMQIIVDAGFVHTVNGGVTTAAEITPLAVAPDSYGRKFYPTGGLQTLRLEVGSAGTTLLLDDVVVGSTPVVPSDQLDAMLLGIRNDRALSRKITLRQLEITTGPDGSRVWTNRVRTTEQRTV